MPLLRRERPPNETTNALGALANEIERPTPEPNLDERSRWAKRLRNIADDANPQAPGPDDADLMRE